MKLKIFLLFNMGLWLNLGSLDAGIEQSVDSTGNHRNHSKNRVNYNYYNQDLRQRIRNRIAGLSINEIVNIIIEYLSIGSGAALSCVFFDVPMDSIQSIIGRLTNRQIVDILDLVINQGVAGSVKNMIRYLGIENRLYEIRNLAMELHRDRVWSYIDSVNEDYI